MHGCVDGFSRMIVYLHCANNNTSITVLGCFTEATGERGIPNHVRADCGGENVLVADYMILNRGTDRGTFIGGRSIHNQRLWCDVYQGCLMYFYNLFSFMERLNVLDPIICFVCIMCTFPALTIVWLFL